MSAQLKIQLRNELLLRWHLPASDRWLDDFIESHRNPSQPLSALASTAHFRLLASDFTVSLAPPPGQTLPTGASNVDIKEVTLQEDVVVQVLEIIDTGTSKWAQIEAIERVERGEEIRGREVIRSVPSLEDGNTNNSDGERYPGSLSSALAGTAIYGNSRKGSGGPHKLLLQDGAGNKVWAFELERIQDITIVNMNPPLSGASGTSGITRIDGIQIGCKALIKSGTSIRRGLALLKPANTTILGGKVDLWDKRWREGGKARLQQQLDQENAS